MKSILIIDDDKELSKLYAILLEEEGFVVDSAATRSEVFQALEKKPFPKLLLVDARLQGLDGGELIREIREKFPAASSSRFVGYSAISHTPLTKCLEQTVHSFWEKPNDVDVFISLISREWAIFTGNL